MMNEYMCRYGQSGDGVGCRAGDERWLRHGGGAGRGGGNVHGQPQRRVAPVQCAVTVERLVYRENNFSNDMLKTSVRPHMKN